MKFRQAGVDKCEGNIVLCCVISSWFLCLSFVYFISYRFSPKVRRHDKKADKKIVVYDKWLLGEVCRREKGAEKVTLMSVSLYFPYAQFQILFFFSFM